MHHSTQYLFCLYVYFFFTLFSYLIFLNFCVFFFFLVLCCILSSVSVDFTFQSLIAIVLNIFSLYFCYFLNLFCFNVFSQVCFSLNFNLINKKKKKKKQEIENTKERPTPQKLDKNSTAIKEKSTTQQTTGILSFFGFFFL